MFMRYRGGSVGHLYMRAIESWLAETGWGSNDAYLPADEDIVLEGGGEGSKNGEDGQTIGNGEDEVPEDEELDSDTEPDQENRPDVDPDIEYLTSEDEEETLEGEFGFSGF